MNKWICTFGISLLLSLTPIYYAKNTSDFSDYCLAKEGIVYETCHLDVISTIFLTTIWFLIIFPIITAFYFLLRKVIRENFPKN